MNLTKIIAVLMLGLATTLAAVLFGWSQASSKSSAPPFSEPDTEMTRAQPAENAEVIDLRQTASLKGLQVQFAGNGRDRLVVTVRNDRSRPVSIRLRPGILLERQESLGTEIALIDRGYLNVAGRAAEPFYLRSVALATSNHLTPAPYQLVRREAPDLEPLFRQIARLPVYSPGAVQTAVLAVRENLPLSAFAQFPLVAGGPLAAVDTEAFRVPVPAIIGALQLLKDAGHPMESVALNVDPQLLVEAMVDPMSRHPAMKFYGIEGRHEWLFWREMLGNGPQSLRHYALHGIGRFYPEIALDMHPRWIRSPEVGPVMRSAAICGLAETGHPDALPILAQLQFDFRDDPSVLSQLSAAEGYLEQAMHARLHAARNQLVAFRYEPPSPRELARDEPLGPLPQ